MLVRDYMRRDVITVNPQDNLAYALKLAREYELRSIPVVLRSRQVTGIITERDIRVSTPSPVLASEARREEFLNTTLVGKTMTREVHTVFPYNTIEEAARMMARHRVRSLPVTDPDAHILGIIGETEILHAFLAVLGGTGPASRIEIALRDRPGQLARALRIIGELKLNIVSVVVPSYPVGEGRVAIVHLGTIDPRDAVESLEAAGFVVGWPALSHDIRAVQLERERERELERERASRAQEEAGGEGTEQEPR